VYKIKLPIFEGPLDLLLFLIRKHELDIYDIPISEILRQFMDYLELLELLDLEVAGEFIEMAASLMLIKTRMLLPQRAAEGEEEPVDPRRELVEQLLEYKRFKEASLEIGEREQEQRRLFPRSIQNLRKEFENISSEEEFLIDATLFDLLSAFKKALDNMPKVTSHQVNLYNVTLEEQIAFIIERLQDRPQILFSELISEIEEKLRLIVTFMALMNLIKVGMVAIRQPRAFDEIRLIAQGPISMSRYMALNADYIPEE